MDRKDLISFFTYLKNKHDNNEEEIIKIFENYEITKLDVNRIYRFIDKYTHYEINNTIEDLED
jgi:hypothetical protein